MPVKHYEKVIKSNWYNKPADGRIHEVIAPYVDALVNGQEWRKSESLKHAREYGNAEMLGLTMGDFMRKTSLKKKDLRIKLNIIRNMVDTLSSKIAKNRPKPQFLTVNGNHSLQKKAQRLSDFMESLFLKTGIYQEMPKAFRDGLIFKKGFVHIYRDGDEIKVERVLPTEIIIDDMEAVNGEPRQMHRRKMLAREVLHGWVNDENKDAKALHNAINCATSADIRDYSGTRITNMVEVTFSWHLPSIKIVNNSPDHDGRFIITIPGATLSDEPYAKSYFPFVELPWDPPLIGYWGQGLVEQLSSIQYEINLILQRIQQALYFFGRPFVFVPPASIIKTDMTNDMLNMIEYNGDRPPSIMTPVAMNAETYMHLDRLIRQAYEISGVSQLSASSKKPAGLVSGVALQEYNDLETERFMLAAQMYENSFMIAARQMIDLAKEIADDVGSFPLMVRSGEGIEKIDWNETNLAEDEYQMQVWPVSLFSGSPSAKLQKIETLINLKILDSKEEIAKLLDFPDLKSYTNSIKAKAEIFEKMIEECLKGNPLPPPDPLLDLSIGSPKMSLAYCNAKMQGVKPQIIEQMRQWILRAGKMQPKPQAAGFDSAQPVVANPGVMAANQQIMQ